MYKSAKIGGVDIELRNRVTTKLQECIDIAENYYGRTFPMPTIKYEVRGRVAGTANDSTYTVDFNKVLLMENVEDFIARTVPHEFAHLVDGIVNPHTRETDGVQWTRRGPRRAKRSVHGPSWKAIMRLLGASTDRCHSYDTTNSRVKTKSKFEYKCSGCGASITMGPVRHKKQQSGRASYSHSGCGRAPLEFVEALGQVTYAEAKQKREAPKKPTARAPKAGSKASRAMGIFESLTRAGLGRSSIIAQFMEELDMTKAGASTYFYNCQKKAA